MDVLKVTGPIALRGTTHVGGAKNAALPIMAAALLTDAPLTLHRVPNVTDVSTLARVLTSLGVRVSRQQDSVALQTIDSRPCRALASQVRRMRASICVLGPLLAKRGRAVVPMPGGCSIGARPIELHLVGLAALGAELRMTATHCVARAKRLRGTTIDLLGPFGPTVTGTANVMSAAVLARGRTAILHAAREPEVVALGEALRQMGARIDGLGTDTIEIVGIDQLGSAELTNIPDRIEASTLLLAGAITRGQIEVTGAAANDLRALLTLLDASGVRICVQTTELGDQVRLDARAGLRSFSAHACPFPGLPTDVQPMLTALATQAQGVSELVDDVFPERWNHVRSLARLGADVRQHASGATITGACKLRGAVLRGADLRGTAALLLASLAARGTSTIAGLRHLDRGYDRLEQKLAALGAKVERVAHSQRAPLNVG